MFLRTASSPGPLLRDFEAYDAAGAAWNAGVDPYGGGIWRFERTIPGVSAAREELLPFVSPPPAILWWSLLARLPYASALAAWQLILGAAALTAIVLSLWFAGVRPHWECVVATALFALSFGPLTSGLALGQIAPVAFAALLVGQRALLAARRVTAMLGVVVAALQPNIAFVLVTQIGARRSAAPILGAGAAFAIVAFGVAARIGGLGSYLHALAAHGLAERFSTIQLTPTAIAFGFGAGSTTAVLWGIVVATAAIAATTWTLTTGRYDAISKLSIGSAALPLAMPFFHEHDLVVTFLPALVTLVRARGGLWLLAALSSATVAVDWLGLAQRTAAIPQSIALGCAAALAIAVFAPHDGHAAVRRTVVVAATLGALVPAAFAVWLAAHHPAPVWPDALPPGFKAAGDAAAVWRAEQSAAGLERPDATWAGLRTLSLLGCAGIWAAAALALRNTRLRYPP